MSIVDARDIHVSDAYDSSQIKYIWKNGEAHSIKTSRDMRLSQFDLIDNPAYNLTVRNRSGTSKFYFHIL